MTIYRLRLLTSIVLLTAMLSACVRYYPTREEMNRPYGQDPALEYVGEKAFFAYDVEQRKRLNELIAKRLERTPGSWDTAYRIGPGDRLKLEVKNFEEVSKEYKVNLEGVIKLPFVGSLEVTNLTEEQLSAQVAKVVQDYVLEPQVHVEVTDHSAHKVWVVSGGYQRAAAVSSGEQISNSRAYPLSRPNYSLVELLVELGFADRLGSGGVLYLYPSGALHAGNSMKKEELLESLRVSIADVASGCSTQSAKEKDEASGAEAKLGEADCIGFSQSPYGSERVTQYHENARIMIDLEELFGGNHQPPLYVPLRPGDAVYFPPAPIIQVFGEVNRRGTFHATGSRGGGDTYSGGNVKPTLMSVLAEARGLTYAADIHNFEIYRELDFGRKVVLKFDFEKYTLRGATDLKLRDGDIVWVPSQAGRFVEEHSINALNQAIGAGNNVYTTSTQ